MVETLILLGCWIGIFAYGAVEQRNHFARLHRIPVRVHVNGIRGKSTVTRLLGYTGGLPGYNTAAYYLPEKDATIIVFTMDGDERDAANKILLGLMNVTTPELMPK